MRREFPEEHEEPWSEEEWLEDMKRSDARADRFGELLETLRDHPDRDELVAREMGWDEFADDIKDVREQGFTADTDELEGEFDFPEDDDDDDEDSDEDDEFDFPSFPGIEGIDEADDEDDEEEEPEEVRHPQHAAEDPVEPEDELEREFLRGESSRKIWEFRRAHQVSMLLHEIMKPYSTVENDPTDGLLGEAIAGPMIASAKIVGGHSLGYDRHYINGNIARQRIGLDAMDKSIEAWKQLEIEKHVPSQIVARVLPELIALRSDLAARIERMRAYARRLHRM